MDWESSGWEFETARLRVLNWQSRGQDALATFLVSALTDEVTRELPPTWQGGLTLASAPAWIAERERDGKMFMVETKDDCDQVGVFMFFPGEATRERGEVRLGYVFAEAAWGQGYATELVKGFLRCWQDKGVAASLLAGVSAQNIASRRVLEKAGFSKVGERDGILDYRLHSV